VLATRSMERSAPVVVTTRSVMAMPAVTMMVAFGAGRPTRTVPRSMAAGDTAKSGPPPTTALTDTSSGVTAPGLAVMAMVPLHGPTAVGVTETTTTQDAPGARVPLHPVAARPAVTVMVSGPVLTRPTFVTVRVPVAVAPTSRMPKLSIDLSTASVPSPPGRESPCALPPSPTLLSRRAVSQRPESRAGSAATSRSASGESDARAASDVADGASGEPGPSGAGSTAVVSDSAGVASAAASVGVGSALDVQPDTSAKVPATSQARGE